MGWATSPTWAARRRASGLSGCCGCRATGRDVAEVQASLSDLRDVTLLPLHDLEALM